jgi:hypothetical protein
VNFACRCAECRRAASAYTAKRRRTRAAA